MTPILAVESSANTKVGNVSATYAPQQTCPKSCPFMGSGCYAESGLVGMQTRKINRMAESEGLTKLALAKMESTAIRKLSGLRPLRLHVVGDATTNQAAKMLSTAAAGYTAKHGSKVWTYTHAWQNVKRTSWGSVSVLASCESIEAAGIAMLQGYAAAVVVSEHASGTATIAEDGIRIIPCPQQTGRAANCLECGLCMRADWLHASRSVIQFAAHGPQEKKTKQALVQISKS